MTGLVHAMTIYVLYVTENILNMTDFKVFERYHWKICCHDDRKTVNINKDK